MRLVRPISPEVRLRGKYAPSPSTPSNEGGWRPQNGASLVAGGGGQERISNLKNGIYVKAHRLMRVHAKFKKEIFKNDGVLQFWVSKITTIHPLLRMSAVFHFIFVCPIWTFMKWSRFILFAFLTKNDLRHASHHRNLKFSVRPFLTSVHWMILFLTCAHQNLKLVLRSVQTRSMSIY